jgi:predicted transcriptional regulator
VASRNHVTETELAILDVLWDHGQIAVREIVDALYDEHRPSLHATVKSLLDRLIEKGFVERDASQFAHQFSAKVDRATFVGQQLQQIVNSHYDGAIAPMLHALVDHTKLSRKDRVAIRRIIDEVDE